MTTALVTTTINVPDVLVRYREFDSSVTFFVVGDRKTPHDDVKALMGRLGNAFYFSDSDQEQLGYKCSEIIGWNKIMRRNIGVLEAAKGGFDVIVSIDDDNIPLAPSYFESFRSVLTEPFTGLEAQTETDWFNVGAFLTPMVYHRGFPHDLRARDLGLHL